MTLSLAPIGAFAAGTVFSDVTGNEYYAEAALALEKLDIFTGYDDGTFGADKSITRSEMAAVVCRMIGKENDARNSKGATKFDDVPADHWASGYINVAAKDKIINGNGSGGFMPNDDVKYEEAIKMVVCGVGLGDDVESESDDWSAGYIKAAEDNGITDNLKGQKGIASTRGDIAVMVYNGLRTTVAAPVASVEAGTYYVNQLVTLKSDTEGVKIYYTTDGTEPTVNSDEYTGGNINILSTATLKAIAVKDDVLVSDVMSVEYTISRSTGGGGSSGGTTRYNVTFDLNYAGAKNPPATQKVKKNGYAERPDDPEREGYIFTGWYTDEECVYEFDFENTEITERLTLYAGWEEENEEDGVYTVTFDLNYDGRKSSQSVTEGDYIDKPEVDNRIGYIFGGWYRDRVFTEPFDFDNYRISEDILLYALWNENTTIIKSIIDESKIINSEKGYSYFKDQLLLEVTPEKTYADIELLAKSFSGRIIGYIADTNSYQIEFDNVESENRLNSIAEELKKLDYIQDVTINYTNDISVEAYYPNDEKWADIPSLVKQWDEDIPDGNNWGVEAIKAPSAWENKDDFSSLNIGLIEVGIPENHIDLNISDRFTFSDELTNSSHATHVCGTMAATFDNKTGIAGVAPNESINGKNKYAIYSYSVGGNGGIQAAKVAFSELLNNKVQVINVSMGYLDAIVFAINHGVYDAEQMIRNNASTMEVFLKKKLDEVKDDEKKDFVIVQAAGNTNNDNFVADGDIEHDTNHDIRYGYRKARNGDTNILHEDINAVNGYYLSAITDEEVNSHIIVVGACKNSGNNNYELCDFSNVGDRVDVIAPGYDIYSTIGTNDYDTNDGTSMAAPHVSGVAAMVWSANPDLSGSDVKGIIVNTANQNVKNTDKKMINAEQAVIAAKKSKNSIQGRVCDSSSGSYLENVYISVYDSYDNKVAEGYTNSKGSFIIPCKAGTYSLICEKEMYYNTTVTNVIVEKGLCDVGNVRMNEKVFERGDGTEENPYQVSTPQQLNAVRNNLSASYIQTNDIDLSEYSNWIPIGIGYGGSSWLPGISNPNTESAPFNGKYDGNGFKISNLTINSGDYDTVGLFGLCTEKSTIENISLVDVNINVDKIATDYEEQWNNGVIYSLTVGGIVGSCGTIINNCHVSGIIKAINCNDAYVGGIAGMGRVRNSSNEAEIYVMSNRDARYKNSSTVCVGGIVGHSDSVNGLVYDNINYGKVTATAGNFLYCGGISGEYGDIRHCVNYGEIHGVTTNYTSYSSFAGNCNVGGIVGATSSNNTIHSANLGTVVSISKKGGSTYAGGIAGYCGYYSSGRISDCYNGGTSIKSIYQREESDGTHIETAGTAGRIAGVSFSTTECYSSTNTAVNGSIPTDNLGSNTINGESESMDFINDKIDEILNHEE